MKELFATIIDKIKQWFQKAIKWIKERFAAIVGWFKFIFSKDKKSIEEKKKLIKDNMNKITANALVSGNKAVYCSYYKIRNNNLSFTYDAKLAVPDNDIKELNIKAMDMGRSFVYETGEDSGSNIKRATIKNYHSKYKEIKAKIDSNYEFVNSGEYQYGIYKAALSFYCPASTDDCKDVDKIDLACHNFFFEDPVDIQLSDAAAIQESINVNFDKLKAAVDSIEKDLKETKEQYQKVIDKLDKAKSKLEAQSKVYNKDMGSRNDPFTLSNASGKTMQIMML